MERTCESCAYFCDGLCDLKGFLRDEFDTACKKYIRVNNYEDQYEQLNAIRELFMEEG